MIERKMKGSYLKQRPPAGRGERRLTLCENMRAVPYVPFYLALAGDFWRSEGLDIAHVVSPSTAQTATGYAPNLIPTEPAGLDATLVALYREYERLAGAMLRVFAAALRQPEDFFGGTLSRHFSILSCHHYPVLTEPPLLGQLRTGAHTDYGAMTILAATDAEGGLEVRLPDGNWAGVKPRPGEAPRYPVITAGEHIKRKIERSHEGT
jgi:isopenicillin N synthase-like dioxygenase